MKKGKRVKPVFPIEYRLFITPRYDERKKEVLTYIALRTVTEFRNFHYEIIVTPELAGNTLTLGIHGLRAPQVTIPGSGPAEFSAELKEMKGRYTVIISKLDKMQNSFTINISNNTVTVEKSPEPRFVDIVTNEQEW
jgi:hypothetical protein